MECGIQKSFDELSILGEEQDVAQESADCFETSDGAEVILRTLFEQAGSLKRSRCVCARAGQFTGKRSSVGAIAASDSPNVGDFVG